MKNHPFTVTASIHPRNAGGSIGSSVGERTLPIHARSRAEAMRLFRAELDNRAGSQGIPASFVLTFLEVKRTDDPRPYLSLSPGSNYRGADMGRVSTLPIGSGPLKMHLLRVRLDSGGYDSSGAYWGHGKPLYRAVSSIKVPTAYGSHLDPISTGKLDHVERFTRADSRDEAKALVRQVIPGATFYR